MNVEQRKAEVKAAAYGLVALLGTSRAVQFLRDLISTIEQDQWDAGRGGR